jgi:hypothetical protein
MLAGVDARELRFSFSKTRSVIEIIYWTAQYPMFGVRISKISMAFSEHRIIEIITTVNYWSLQKLHTAYAG